MVASSRWKPACCAWAASAAASVRASRKNALFQLNMDAPEFPLDLICQLRMEFSSSRVTPWPANTGQLILISCRIAPSERHFPPGGRRDPPTDAGLLFTDLGTRRNLS